MDKKLYILIQKRKDINELLELNQELLSLDSDYRIFLDGRVLLRVSQFFSVPSKFINYFPKLLFFDQDGIFCKDMSGEFSPIEDEIMICYLPLKIKFYLRDSGDLEINVPFRQRNSTEALDIIENLAVSFGFKGIYTIND